MRYSDEVLRRVREPKRAGSLDGDRVGTGEVGTLDEGTVMRIQVRRDGDRISEARFKVFGCSAAIASASIVTEWLEGAAIDEAKQVTPERVVQVLELAPEREYVARMAVDAGLKAVESAFARGNETSSGETAAFGGWPEVRK
jgi:NifU-like protein involved in Fe-S cluster formation